MLFSGLLKFDHGRSHSAQAGSSLLMIKILVPLATHAQPVFSFWSWFWSPKSLLLHHDNYGQLYTNLHLMVYWGCLLPNEQGVEESGFGNSEGWLEQWCTLLCVIDCIIQIWEIIRHVQRRQDSSRWISPSLCLSSSSLKYIIKCDLGCNFRLSWG
jgi:hypothetical protein